MSGTSLLRRISFDTENLAVESIFYTVSGSGSRQHNSNVQPQGPSAALNRTIAGLALAVILFVVIAVLGSLFLVRDPDTVQTALGDRTGANFASQLATFRRIFPIIGGAVIFGVAITALSALRRVKRLQDDATTDPLTGIYNRSEVRNRLAELLWNRRDARVAALSVDLDEFRDVNDTWGREVGDELLVEFTERLSTSIGNRGFVGRLGAASFWQ